MQGMTFGNVHKDDNTAVFCLDVPSGDSGHTLQFQGYYHMAWFSDIFVIVVTVGR